jgi:FkbM family methyltransferase
MTVKELKKLVGANAYWIKLFRTLRTVPFTVRLPVFGAVSTVDEVLNIHDNFGRGELRDAEIENHLHHTRQPIVVDCGVNIGITIRWWRFLNPNVRVFGFDMMEEAHTFTRNRLGLDSDWYQPITCALAAEEGTPIEVSFDDPLSGENSVAASNRSHTRTVSTGTLDSCLRPFRLERIDLLKMDIEGHGAEALKAAAETLRKTRYVMFETHNRNETAEATGILHNAGFELIGMRGRTLIYKGKRKSPVLP